MPTASATPTSSRSGLALPEIVYIQFTDPTAYPPLEHSALLLQKEGWKVAFLGVRWPGSVNFSFTPALEAQCHLLPAPPAGWRQKLFYLVYISWILLDASLRRPTWIYASDPMAAPAGLLLCWLGFRVVYHEHDSPDGKPRTCFDTLIRLSRRQLARRAAFNILPQDMRCKIFKLTTGTKRPVLRVWNCPRLDEVCASPRPARQADEPLGIYYHGSINLTRLPLELIEAAGLSGLPIVIRAVGYETIGSVGALMALRQAAEPFQPLLKLELAGALSRHQLPDQMNGMHLGWIAYSEAIADINLMYLAGASNKAFDYLANGLPLVINQDMQWQRIFEEYKLSITCEAINTLSILQVLHWSFQHPSKLAEMSEIAVSVAKSEFTYERQFSVARNLIARQ